MFSAPWIAALLPDDYEFAWPQDEMWVMPEGGPTWGEAFYRVSFAVPDPGMIARAALFVRSRVRSDVHCNGREIKRCAHWLGTYEIELTPFLKRGKNTLAIKCTDRDQDRPFLCATLAVREVGGGVRMLAAGDRAGGSARDGEWKAVPRSVPAEWTQVWFDDRAWPAVVAAPAELCPKPSRRPQKGPRPLEFVKTFTPPPNLVGAVARVTALGGYRLRINGIPVGEAVLTPGWTAYERRVEYQTYDITSLLTPGRPSEIRLFAASLWWGLGLASYAEAGLDTRLKACLQIEITDASGGTTMLTTDASWRAEPCAVLQSSLYHGEVHDYAAPAGGAAVPVEVVQWPGELVLAAAEPVCVTGELAPVSLRRTAWGSWVADFGQNLAGWPALRTPIATTPLRLHVQTAERLNPDGSLNLDALRSAKSQEVFYLPPAPASGERAAGVPEWLEPRLTYHGFRYVEIHGWPDGAPLAPDDLRFRVVHANVRAVGDFRSSSPMLDAIFQNFVRSLRSNFHAVPTDCPQRDERLGWMADAGNIPHAIAWCFDISRYFDKWVVDMEDCQAANGHFPNFAPCFGLKGYGSSRGAPGWADAGVNVPWALYERYGDLERLRAHYPFMRRHVESLAAEAVDYLVPSGGWGDWLAVENSPAEPLGTAFFYRSAEQVARAAEVLGLPDDAARYRGLADAIARAYHRAYFDEATGDYANGTQTMNILPVAFGITPTELRPAVVARVVANLAAHEDHLTTGFIGTTFLIPTLAAYGHHDLALRILLQRDYPSWGRIIEAGSTTITEAWNAWLGDDFASHNHFNLGSVIEWFFTGLLGLQPELPGFRRFRFRPVFPAALDHASGHHDVAAGRIAVAWKRVEGDRIHLTLDIPAGVCATVELPGLTAGELTGPASGSWTVMRRRDED